MLIVVVVISGRPGCFVCHLGTQCACRTFASLPHQQLEQYLFIGRRAMDQQRTEPCDAILHRQQRKHQRVLLDHPHVRFEALSKFLFHSLLSFSLLRFPAADVISGILKIIVSSSGLATLSALVLSLPLSLPLCPGLCWCSMNPVLVVVVSTSESSKFLRSLPNIWG